MNPDPSGNARSLSRGVDAPSHPLRIGTHREHDALGLARRDADHLGAGRGDLNGHFRSIADPLDGAGRWTVCEAQPLGRRCGCVGDLRIGERDLFAAKIRLQGWPDSSRTTRGAPGPDRGGASALSPRPIPSTMRPPDNRCSVSAELAVTAGCRVTGLVTDVASPAGRSPLPLGLSKRTDRRKGSASPPPASHPSLRLPPASRTPHCALAPPPSRSKTPWPIPLRRCREAYGSAAGLYAAGAFDVQLDRPLVVAIRRVANGAGDTVQLVATTSRGATATVSHVVRV